MSAARALENLSALGLASVSQGAVACVRRPLPKQRLLRHCCAELHSHSVGSAAWQDPAANTVSLTSWSRSASVRKSFAWEYSASSGASGPPGPILTVGANYFGQLLTVDLPSTLYTFCLRIWKQLQSLRLAPVHRQLSLLRTLVGSKGL